MSPPFGGNPSSPSSRHQLWGRLLGLILGAAALVVHTDGEERLVSLGTEMSKGLSLTRVNLPLAKPLFLGCPQRHASPLSSQSFSCGGQASRSWARDPLVTGPKQEHLASSCSRRLQCSWRALRHLGYRLACKEIRQEGSLERDSSIWLLDSQHKHTLKRKVFPC